MLSLLSALLVGAAAAPAPDASPRIEGFRAVDVRADSFVDGLQPDPPPAAPAASPVARLTPREDLLRDLGLGPEQLVAPLAALPGVTAVEVDGPTLRITLEVARDLADEPVTLAGRQVRVGDLGSLRLLGTPPPSPRLPPTGPIRPATPPGERSLVVVVVLDQPRMAEVGLAVEELLAALRGLEGVMEVELAPAGESVKLELDVFRDLTTAPIPVPGRDPIPLGSLGEIKTFPRTATSRLPAPTGPAAGPPGVFPLPIPVRPPPPVPGHDLRVVNELGARVVVVLGAKEVGELDPRATGVIHDVHPGSYTVVLAGPDGARRELVLTAELRVAP